MKFYGAYGQARVFIITLLIGCAFTGLTTLTAHYGMKASRIDAENVELREQVRDLVTRIAELETLVSEVGRERQAVEDVTLATLGAVLDTTTIDREKHGPLYVATLTNGDRATAAVKTTPAGPPVSVAQMAALVDRTARVRAQATELVKDLRATNQAVGVRRDILAAIPSRLPASGWISSSYGIRNSPFHSGDVMHNGLDIAADEGTPVYAPADGEVMFAGVFGGFGKYIRLSHGFGIGTRFAHNAEILVKKGQKVRRGDQIAVIGSTGRSTGPHLHYEVMIHGEQVDPARFVLDGNSIKSIDLLAKAPLRQPAPPKSLGIGGEADPRERNPTDTTLEKTIQEEVMAEAAAGEAATEAPGLFFFTTGERLFASASLAGPFGRATTSDLVLLVVVLVLMSIAGSLVNLPETALTRAFGRGRDEDSAGRRFWQRPGKLDVWAGHGDDEE